MFTQEKCSKVWCINHIFTDTGGLSQGDLLGWGVGGGGYREDLNFICRIWEEGEASQGHHMGTQTPTWRQIQTALRGHPGPKAETPDLGSEKYLISTTQPSGQTAEDPQHGGPPQALPPAPGTGTRSWDGEAKGRACPGQDGHWSLSL